VTACRLVCTSRCPPAGRRLGEEHLGHPGRQDAAAKTSVSLATLRRFVIANNHDLHPPTVTDADFLWPLAIARSSTRAANAPEQVLLQSFEHYLTNTSGH
jgi:hypothetical protein